jgi:superfamily II DNA or RNA helicase
MGEQKYLEVRKMNLRDQRQIEFANLFEDRGILYLCPRFGKIRTSVIILKKLNLLCYYYGDNDGLIALKNILICYPDNTIKTSWNNEFVQECVLQNNITYCNFRSLDKYIPSKKWDLIIIDEIHMLSEAQVGVLLSVPNSAKILGLTGTLSSTTEKYLWRALGLKVLGRYPIEQAIEEGIIADYEIRVVKVDLDNNVKIFKSGSKKKGTGLVYRTEKEQHNVLTWTINKLQAEGKNADFVRLNRMRLLQSSIARTAKTKELLMQFIDNRCLVFCGTTEICDKVSLFVYHSDNKDSNILDSFLNGTPISLGRGLITYINHLAVAKMLNQGITVKPIKYGIINSFDRNPETMAQRVSRFLSYEYDNPGKRGIIYIICTTEKDELEKLEKALSFFDNKKIIYE